MKTTSALLLIASLLSFGPNWALASERMTEHTLKLSPGEKPPPAKIADMKWLAGHWVGEAFGGTAEELWAEPVGDTMAGMYRLHKQGKTIFYEILTVSEKDGSLVVRLKHFNPDLTGWEEKNEVQSFSLVAKRDGALQFEGMSFHPQGDQLTVYLAIEHKDKPVEEMTFKYRRAAP
jgi:hypothetical protein